MVHQQQRLTINLVEKVHKLGSSVNFSKCLKASLRLAHLSIGNVSLPMAITLIEEGNCSCDFYEQCRRGGGKLQPKKEVEVGVTF